MTCPGHPGVLRTKKEALDETNSRDPPSNDHQCQGPASPGNNQKPWKSANIDDHNLPSSFPVPCGGSAQVPKPLGARRHDSDIDV